MSLLDSLKTLDPTDDSLWTEDGLPTIEAAKAVSGLTKLTRSQINEVALGLTRANVTEFTTAPVVATEEVVTEAVVETVVTFDEGSYDAVNAELTAMLRQKEEFDAKLKELTNKQAVMSVEANKQQTGLTADELHGLRQDALAQEIDLLVKRSQALQEQGFTDEQIERILRG